MSGGYEGSKRYQSSEHRGPCVSGILFCIGLSGAKRQTQDAGRKNLYRVKKIFGGSELF